MSASRSKSPPPVAVREERPVSAQRTHAPAHLRAAVLAAAATTPARTRPEGTRRAGLVYGLSILVSSAAFEHFGGFAHGAGRPRAVTTAIATGAVLLAIAASAIGWHRGRSMAGRSTTWLALPPALLPVLTLAWLTSFHSLYTEPFSRVGYRCLALSMVIGGSLLAATVFVRRRTVLASPYVSGASLGAVVAAWSAVMVDLWCPLTNLPHVLVGHVLPIVLLVGAGTALGRLLPPRARELPPAKDHAR